MSTREIVKEYTNGELTVVWKPQKCIHAGICVKTLPKVYDPKAKPWITPENATTEELKHQINQCPSGALSFYMNGAKPEDKTNTMSNEKTKAEIMKDGPLLVYGDLQVVDAEGNSEIKSNTTAFCRCGASSNKPYCDGSHSKISFKG
jgi:uncharacterized Fe-S cluster protein YjdI